MRPRNSFLLAVCGPTGAGKSTLGALIAKRARCQFIAEPIPKETLEAFSKNPVENGFVLQREILGVKISKFRKVSDAKCIVMDRTIAEDRQVFFNLHHSLGFLSGADVQTLLEKSYQ